VAVAERRLLTYLGELEAEAARVREVLAIINGRRAPNRKAKARDRLRKSAAAA
jgi:hypothetical protein